MAAGLQGDGSPVLLQRDECVAIIDGAPAVSLRELSEQRLDALRSLKAKRREGRPVKAELLVLGANTEPGSPLAPARKEGGEVIEAAERCLVVKLVS